MSKSESVETESRAYQGMLDELNDIVAAMESPAMDLDQMVSKVETGYDLIRKLRQRLEQTKMRVDELRAEFEQEARPTSPESV